MAGAAVSEKILCPHAERPSGWLRTGRRTIGGTQSRAFTECYGIILKR